MFRCHQIVRTLETRISAIRDRGYRQLYRGREARVPIYQRRGLAQTQIDLTSQVVQGNFHPPPVTIARRKVSYRAFLICPVVRASVLRH